MSMPHNYEVQLNGGVCIQNLKRKTSTCVEDTNEYIGNYDGYVKRLNYVVDGNANLQPYF